MGAVNFSLSPDLVEALSDALPLDVLVETGTFEGDTIAGMVTRFSEIHSVELSAHYVAKAKARFADDAHVHIAHGDSPGYLKQLVPALCSRGVLYYLDAHWCVASNTAGDKSQCPLLDEIGAISRLDETSVIVIDDARLFLAPPPAPHDISQWPSFDEIITALRRLSAGHELMVVNDVIAFYPPAARDALNAFARKHGVDWLHARQAQQQNAALRASLEEKESVIQTQDNSIARLHEGLAQMAKGLHDKAAVVPSSLIEAEATAPASKERSAAVQEQVPNIEGPSMAMELPHQESMQRIVTALASAEVNALLLKGLEEKEAVIQEINKALIAYRSAFGKLGFIARPFTRVLFNFSSLVPRPRLGTLYHHAPRDVLLPRSYSRERVLTGAPRISLVTPSFRQAAFIERTISSVLGQNYPNLEYFVQDGGSEDGTRGILERYADRLTGWESRPDEGQSQAINLGFAQTSGDIMAWLNSDDVLLPGALNCVIDFFNRNPDIDVVYGHRLLIDENDRLIGRWILPAHDDKILSWADYVPQETLFWRRSIWEKAGSRIDESFRFAMDWDLLLRFRDAGARIARIPRFLGGFRIHPHQKTSAAIGEIGFKEMDRLRERSLGRLPTHSEVRSAVMPYLLRHVACEIGWKVREKFAGHR